MGVPQHAHRYPSETLTLASERRPSLGSRLPSLAYTPREQRADELAEQLRQRHILRLEIQRPLSRARSLK